MALKTFIDLDAPANSGGYIVSEDWVPRVWTVDEEFIDGAYDENVIYRDDEGRRVWLYKGCTLEACQTARATVEAKTFDETPGYGEVWITRSWAANSHTSPKAYDFELTVAKRYSYRNGDQKSTT